MVLRLQPQAREILARQLTGLPLGAVDTLPGLRRRVKCAGYDGIVVTGAAETSVRIRIRGDKVSILPADDLWGQDAMDALEALASAEGRGVRSLAIGPAGERLSRIATIQTASSSACGQGSFGAVLRSKKLKAISVAGSRRG